MRISKLRSGYLCLCLLSAFVFVPVGAAADSCRSTGQGVCRYVDASNGNDANPGTSAAPFRTIQAAANVVNPGDFVVVRAGVYSDTSLRSAGGTLVNVTRGGNSNDWITFAAETHGSVVLDGRDNNSAVGWNLVAPFVRVQGFDSRGFSQAGFQISTSASAAHPATPVAGAQAVKPPLVDPHAATGEHDKQFAANMKTERVLAQAVDKDPSLPLSDKAAVRALVRSLRRLTRTPAGSRRSRHAVDESKEEGGINAVDYSTGPESTTPAPDSNYRGADPR